MVFSARSDFPLGIPKGDAWIAQESDRYGYKDFQSSKCLFRIKNADTFNYMQRLLLTIY